ncbi:MAG: hypothetical protein KA158_11310 [Leucobacter sp.]|nr:hypothetical protein [Leucobacter sp.]
MAAKFFTGLPLDGPDPECVGGEADVALTAVNIALTPRPAMDHTKPGHRPGTRRTLIPVTGS